MATVKVLQLPSEWNGSFGRVKSPTEIWNVVLPYVGVPITDGWTQLVLSDVGKKLSLVNPDGFGPLHFLLQDGDYPTWMSQCLEVGADPELKSFTQMATPEAVDLRGATALHFAVYYGRIESLKVLLDVGVDLASVTTDGLRAADVAKKGKLNGNVLRKIQQVSSSLTCLGRLIMPVI